MPNAQKTEIDALRQQLADADKKRRELLLELFLKHGDDHRPFLELLFDSVPVATLDRIETMLAKGGA